MIQSNYRTKLRLFVFCLCACGFWLVLLPLGKVQAESGDRIHIVQPGETLGSIASRYGISYQQLARHNGMSNPNLVRVGQRLRIPSIPSSNSTLPAAPKPPAVPLAEKVTPAEPSPVTPSPASPPHSCRGELSHSVRSGDSLHRIAASYGVTTSALIARNNLPSTLIVVGQRLIIPANC
jgi:LysM repeat protein